MLEYNRIGDFMLAKPMACASVLFVITGFHNSMQKAMGMKNVAFFSIKGNDYRIHFW